MKAVWEKKKKNNVSLLKNGRLDVLVISWNVGSLALLPNSYKKSFNLLLTLDNQKTRRKKRKRKREEETLFSFTTVQRRTTPVATKKWMQHSNGLPPPQKADSLLEPKALTLLEVISYPFLIQLNNS